MRTNETSADHRRKQPFSLPAVGAEITSIDTGITYTIGVELGGGGFGTVYACGDDWGHDLVAKVLRPVGDEQEMEVRAVSEALAANVARSPHIVQVHDAFLFEGAYYIISERCAFSLQDLMDGENLNRDLWFPSLAKAVLHALHFMHTRGLAHCDVHPGNVMLHIKDDCIVPTVQSAFDFKLGDFGQTRLTHAVAPTSTWNYACIPPEILDTQFGPIDIRADLYQAGLLFLRFLSPSVLDFDREEILSGQPREAAEFLMHPAAGAIATLLRRRVDFRPGNALQAWSSLKGVLARS